MLFNNILIESVTSDMYFIKEIKALLLFFIFFFFFFFLLLLLLVVVVVLLVLLLHNCFLMWSGFDVSLHRFIENAASLICA